jgi:hypothetical protein
VSRTVLRYTADGHKVWSDNTPAEPRWASVIHGSRIEEQPGRPAEETRLRAEKAAARRQTT